MTFTVLLGRTDMHAIRCGLLQHTLQPVVSLVCCQILLKIEWHTFLTHSVVALPTAQCTCIWPLTLVPSDTILCCSVVLSEWMFGLAAQLDAAKYGEALLLNCLLVMLVYNYIYSYSISSLVLTVEICYNHAMCVRCLLSDSFVIMTVARFSSVVIYSFLQSQY